MPPIVGFLMAVSEGGMCFLIGTQVKAACEPARRGRRGRDLPPAIFPLCVLLAVYQSRHVWELPSPCDVVLFQYLLRLASYYLFFRWYTGCSTQMGGYYAFVTHLLHGVGTGLRRVPVMGLLEGWLGGLLPGQTIPALVYNVGCKNLITLLVFLVFIRVFRFRSVQDGALLGWKTLSISEVFQAFINETSYFLLLPAYSGDRLVEVAISFYIAAIEVFVFTVFVITVKSAGRSRDNAELLAKEANSQYILTALNDYIISEKKFRSLRHDMRNHLMVLQQMTRDNGPANAYIKTLIDGFIAPAGSRFRTGNLMLDGLFSMKHQVMETKGIEFQSSVFFGGDLFLSVTDADLSIIFGNLLDNAIEAAQELEGTRYIRARSQRKGGYLCVTVSNSYSGQVFGQRGRLRSTKAAEGHGYGLENVRSAMERVGGSLTIDYSDPEEFWAVLLFPLEGGEEDFLEVDHDV